MEVKEDPELACSYGHTENVAPIEQLSEKDPMTSR